ISVKQLKQYLSDPSLANINNLHYLFDKRKLLAQYGKDTFQNVDEALLAVKNKFKGIFTNKTDEIFEVIWGNPNLRNDLFPGLPSSPSPQQKLQYMNNQFNTLINNVDSKLYKFINVK
ncbi:hypothetical protein BWK58_15305, partial [Flavobacterium columnare]